MVSLGADPSHHDDHVTSIQGCNLTRVILGIMDRNRDCNGGGDHESNQYGSGKQHLAERMLPALNSIARNQQQVVARRRRSCSFRPAAAECCRVCRRDVIRAAGQATNSESSLLVGLNRAWFTTLT